MVKNQNNLAEEVLAHHGVPDMRWGIRRYQPYPSDYTGDGKFIGKRSARKAAKIEKKKARHKAKVETIINNAIRDGDKKALNKIKSEIEESEFKDKYKQLVENGLSNAVKDRNKENLKNFKEDLSPRDYKHQQDRIDFKKAIDDDDSKKAKKLLPKVDPEDVKEATELIKSRVALQDQKLSKIRQDSELMAKLDKVNNSLTRVSNISKNIANISSNIQSMNDSISKFSKSASEAKEEREKKEIEKVVKSGNIAKIEEYKTRMDYNQLKDAYGKVYAMNQKNVDTAIAKGDVDEIYKLMPFMDSEQMTKAITKVKSIRGLGGAYHSDDSEEETLSHHGVPGMKWGVRRFQPYPEGYKGDGKYVGENASKNLAKKIESFTKKRNEIRK